jgi:hypothetical protein
VSDSPAVVCHACGRGSQTAGIVSRAATCDGCGADLRCCLNCRFHDKSAYNECAEPTAERVLEKNRANFCDYFAPRSERKPETKSGKPLAVGDLERLFSKK